MYQGNALTDTFNANRVQCLTLLVHRLQVPLSNTTASLETIVKGLKHTQNDTKLMAISIFKILSLAARNRQ